MAARRLADTESRFIQPVKLGRAPRAIGRSHSGSYPEDSSGRLFRAKEPLPVTLSLRLSTPIKGGPAAAREQLNRDTLLIWAHDPNFASCWFSLPLDLGGAEGNSAFWMLQKTARDTWLLYLRRGRSDVAVYHLKTTKDAFPIRLKKSRVSKEFTNWPRTITVSWA